MFTIVHKSSLLTCSFCVKRYWKYNIKITFFMYFFFYQVLFSFPVCATFVVIVDGWAKQNLWKEVALAVYCCLLRALLEYHQIFVYHRTGAVCDTPFMMERQLVLFFGMELPSSGRHFNKGVYANKSVCSALLYRND